MKILTTTLALTLLATLVTFANTAKVSEPSKKVYQVLEGSTMKSIQGNKSIYQKRGLAVDLEYQSQHVGINQVSEVNITVMTHLTKGILNVELSSANDTLEGIKESNYKFVLLEIAQENKFPINLEVKSEKEGIHYINLNVTLEGDETRLFSVPVNIGKVDTVLQKKPLAFRSNGDSMTVSKAVEEIK